MWLKAGVSLALAGATLLLAPPPDELRASLALFVLVGSLWVTQLVPPAVTALLVPVLAVLGGLAAPREALAPFAHPIIFLFLGGFALAAALHRQGLDHALAQAVMRLAGGRRARAAILLSALAAALSMWISNTATAAMMLPLAIGLLQDETGEAAIGPREQIFVLLALAYGCSLGGIATLVGSPPNAIAAAQAGISFAQWLVIGLPIAVLLWLVMIGILWTLLRPQLGGAIRLQGSAPLVWTRERRVTVGIFAATVAGWIGGGPLARLVGIRADIDTIVALAALVGLVAGGCLRWRELESQVQWGVLLLFGGGLALSELVQAHGASRFMVEHALALAEGAPPILLLAVVVVFVILLTEFVSNTASAALVVPIFLPAAQLLGLSPVAAAMAVAVAASCAFMLPVATPPNAIVFASALVPQSAMMRCGLWLNLGCAAVVTMTTWIASRWI